MNCNECTSQRVCFLQKQIENLADRIVQPPFHVKIDIGGDRTASMALRYTNAITERDKICRKLKEVIALNCQLYLQKDQGAGSCSKQP